MPTYLLPAIIPFEYIYIYLVALPISQFPSVDIYSNALVLIHLTQITSSNGWIFERRYLETPKRSCSTLLSKGKTRLLFFSEHLCIRTITKFRNIKGMPIYN